jgi:hypothetical protein
MSTTNITPGTLAEKLSKLANNIQTLLQEVNNPGESPPRYDQLDSTSAQRDRLSDILRYFNEQQSIINELLSATGTDQTLPDIRRPSSQLPKYYNNAKYEDIICKAIK